MAIGSPSDALPYVRAIQLLLGGYGAYSREKRRETDVAVREEVGRAANRVRNHLNNVHDSAYRADDTALAAACSRAIEEVDALRNDVDKAATGGEHPFFSLQKSASRRTINKLIKHDHDTLQMVTKAVNSSNEMEKTFAEDGECLEELLRCQQLVSSCRGHFSERSKVLRKI
jgi:hypothetical protein